MTKKVATSPSDMSLDATAPMTSFRNRAALALSGVALLAGCISPPAPTTPPLSVADTAAALSARSLSDESLHRFLVQNLGREPTQWDFETLSWVAFYYHPSLEVARAQWAAARAAQTSAAARPNPTLTFTPGFSSNPDAGVSPWFPSLNLDFLLETSGKREQRAAIERFSAEAARLDVFAAAWQVRSDLRRALLDAAALDRRHRLLHALADVQQQLVTLLEQRQQAGAVSAFDVSTARIALIKAESAASEAHHQVAVSRSRIAQTLGLPSAALADTKLAEPSEPAISSSEVLIAARRQSLQSRSDVLAALARYESAQAALQLETAKRFPDIHLGPGYQWDQGQSKWSLGLSVELPVFNRNEGPLAEAAARRNEAAAQLNAVQAQVIAAIDNAVAAQSAATAQLDRTRALRAELEKQSTLVQSRLAAGGADQVDVQSALLELRNAELALADAEAAAATAAGQLEDALQVPFSHLDAVISTAAVPPRSP